MSLLYDLLEDRTLYVSAHKTNSVLSLQAGQWSAVRMPSPRGIATYEGVTGIVCTEGVRFFNVDGVISSLVYYGDQKIEGHGAEFVYGNFTLVATAQNCLLELNKQTDTFSSVWQVPGAYISGISGSYVSALAVSPEWKYSAQSREGVILDDVGSAVIKNLFLPHSPVFTGDCLWFLNSGDGKLFRWDIYKGNLDIVATFEGFARGLKFLTPDYLAVGISQGRITAFSNLETNALAKPGIYVVNTNTGIFEDFEYLDVPEIFEIEIGQNPLSMNGSYS